MTLTDSSLSFRPPAPTGEARLDLHHGEAAAGNIQATTEAIVALDEALAGDSTIERILLRAAAGAGKSYALKRMVEQSLMHNRCRRVGVTAFTNKQIHPLAVDLGRMLGRDRVCLYASESWEADLPASLRAAATVVFHTKDVPEDAEVILGTSHMLGYTGQLLLNHLGPADDGERLFDVLFVDEAWQLALHRYQTVNRLARVDVGVGDVGQLPPIDPGQNPWRGDRTYNPYRAWPTAFEGDANTWAIDLPAVWRPTASQLPLWRAFYRDWDVLDCIADDGDRAVRLGTSSAPSMSVWEQVATGTPTLVEIAGLPDPDAPDIDPPLLGLVEEWIADLLEAGFSLHAKIYGDAGLPEGDVEVRSDDPQGGTLIAVLATRNQAVDDAQAMVERLIVRFSLPEGVLVASTVDAWQGRTNAITVALHPLSGASSLDEFNSAFGRLAVTCTRATHGLLLVSRAGLDELLATAPARPGTPLGEPGTRQLPRQTHERILGTFTRGTYDATSDSSVTAAS